MAIRYQKEGTGLSMSLRQAGKQCPIRLVLRAEGMFSLFEAENEGVTSSWLGVLWWEADASLIPPGRLVVIRAACWKNYASATFCNGGKNGSARAALVNRNNQATGPILKVLCPEFIKLLAVHKCIQNAKVFFHARNLSAFDRRISGGGYETQVK